MQELKEEFLISNLQKENKELQEQIVVLKKLIEKDISFEELICLKQIEILHNRSIQRELSLEEVKKLDLLIKNLRLIKEQSTENLATPRYRDVKESDLVAIATTQSESQDIS